MKHFKFFFGPIQSSLQRHRACPYANFPPKKKKDIAVQQTSGLVLSSILWHNHQPSCLALAPLPLATKEGARARQRQTRYLLQASAVRRQAGKLARRCLPTSLTTAAVEMGAGPDLWIAAPYRAGGRPTTHRPERGCCHGWSQHWSEGGCGRRLPGVG